LGGFTAGRGGGFGCGGVGCGEVGLFGVGVITLPKGVEHQGQTLALLGKARLKYSQLGLGQRFAAIAIYIIRYSL